MFYMKQVNQTAKEEKTLKVSSKIGKIGEDAVCVLLMKHGHALVCRNYLERWGEIDIVSELDGVLHFVEVKSVSREGIPEKARDVTHVTSRDVALADRVSTMKKKRLKRVVQSYLSKNHHSDRSFSIDFALVYVGKDQVCRVRYLENAVF